MKTLARQFKTDTVVLQLAREIIAHVPDKDFAGEAEAVHDWVRDHIRYTLDVDGVEVLHTPRALLELRQGDCDDKATLTATLLAAIGHPSRFVAIAYEPDRFTHVYVETRIGDRWIASDTTEDQPFGWSPPPPLNKMVRDV